MSYTYNTELRTQDQRTWSILIHLGGILFSILPSLIGYLLLRNRGALIRSSAAEALNFQITLLLAYVIATITASFIIGFFLLPVAAIIGLIFPILAAVAAGRDEVYIYPVAIRVLR